MSCSFEHDSTHSNGETTIITIITKDRLTEMERSILYRTVWGYLEEHCIEPKSVKIEGIPEKQKLKKSSAHAKRVIDIPPNVSVDDAMKLYNKGWGHATSAAIGFFTKEI